MTEKRYLDLQKWFCGHSRALAVLKVMYTILPSAIMVYYPVLIIIRAMRGFDWDFFTALLVPLFVFASVTVVRYFVDRPRPYTKYSTKPLIEKSKPGQSFPSRHTASALIIAMSTIPMSAELAVFLLFISALIAVTRVLSGVHYISDVLAGAAFSAAVGTVFFIVL